MTLNLSSLLKHLKLMKPRVFFLHYLCNYNFFLKINLLISFSEVSSLFWNSSRPFENNPILVLFLRNPELLARHGKQNTFFSIFSVKNNLRKSSKCYVLVFKWSVFITFRHHGIFIKMWDQLNHVCKGMHPIPFTSLD